MSIYINQFNLYGIRNCMVPKMEIARTSQPRKTPYSPNRHTIFHFYAKRAYSKSRNQVLLLETASPNDFLHRGKPIARSVLAPEPLGLAIDRQTIRAGLAMQNDNRYDGHRTHRTNGP